ncbi:MAG: type II secretion system protein, partial [Planctomycetota bacterium]|nr:type II secretion system protein [Planctomycetota bacterium]
MTNAGQAMRRCARARGMTLIEVMIAMF